MFFFRAVYAAVMTALEYIAPLFSAKLRKRQKLWRQTVLRANLIINRRKAPVAWLHAASAGEFEQLKPIIEYLANSGKRLTIIASFFSPSGFEALNDYPHAHAAVYLPIDSYFSVKFFLSKIRPDVAIVARYELWFELFRQIRDLTTPLYLISATFPSRRPFVPVFKEILRAIKTIYAANSEAADQFRPYIEPPTELIAANDARFDQIMSVVRRESQKSASILPEGIFSSDDIILAVGSSWPQDEVLLAEALKMERYARARCIIAPHVVSPERLDFLTNLFPDSVKLSELQGKKIGRHIIVDSYGKLLSLYGISHIAYVGGGFGAGAHSAAEPAGYGVPIICGPNIKRSPDAVALHKLGGLQVIDNASDLKNALDVFLFSREKRSKSGTIAYNYINSRVGFSKIIGERILAELQ